MVFYVAFGIGFVINRGRVFSVYHKVEFEAQAD